MYTLRYLKNSWITRLTDICADTERTQISYLSNETDTNIILSMSMDIHLHSISNLIILMLI